MKYIAPGGWFSLEYPAGWREFEDTEESFLFYDPDKWSGNFRISAYRGADTNYGKECVSYELKENPAAELTLIRGVQSAYSVDSFQEEGIWYTSHFWVIDCRDICVECSFTVAKGGDKTVAENIIASIEIRSENKAYLKEIIPIRVLEIGEVNSAYEWASSTIKKQLTKDFSSQEEDIEKIQEVMDSGRFQPQQRMAWENFGVAFGTILVNEMEGMEWVTVIDGKEEYPALQFMNSDMLIDPAAIVWNKAKKNLPCDLKAEFKKIKREAEAVLDDIN